MKYVLRTFSIHALMAVLFALAALVLIVSGPTRVAEAKKEDRKLKQG